MLRTNVYLTEEQERAIRIRATINKKPKAKILRDLINVGLNTTPVQGPSSADIFMSLGQVAEQFRGKGTAPKDLSTNMDKYTWDE